MGGGTYPFAYRSLSALDGGRTHSRSFAYHQVHHDPQISEEGYPSGLDSSLLPSPIQGVDGGRATYFERIYSPSTFPGPAGMHLYSCDTCGKQYSQPQGVSRHRRTAHEPPHPCLFSYCDFKWTRPYKYRAHLEKVHRGVNPDEVLGKPAWARCRSTIIGGDLPQHLSSLATEPDGRTQVEPWRRPMTPTLLPEVAKDPHIPSHAMLFLDHDQPPQYAPPAITMRKHEEPRALEFLGSTDAQIWIPSALPGSTAANPVIPCFSTLAPPSNPDFVDPMDKPYPFTVAGDYETGTDVIPPTDRRRIDIYSCGLWAEPSRAYHTFQRSGTGIM